jgi:hypothetical protein
MIGTMKSALILFAHGARDPEWALPVRRLQAKVAALRPDLEVEIAFLELTAPLLPEAIESLVARHYRRIAIVPVFLAQGVIINIADMAPHTTNAHGATLPAKYALEMNQGWFRKRGIGPGARIEGIDRAPPAR